MNTNDSSTSFPDPAASVLEQLPRSVLHLPEPVPWAEPVAGAELLDELQSTICRFVALPERAAAALALWIVHTYLFKARETRDFKSSKRISRILLPQRAKPPNLLHWLATQTQLANILIKPKVKWTRRYGNP
ncbi:MAG: hypothetical protein C5B50_13115 [Verrucomicrobia bacterium]|nr:MAG: hypothetical protein C5B50_13115 [Verrucomicrobiota bacterium]